VPTSRRALDVQLPVEAGSAEDETIMLEVGPGDHLALKRQPVPLAALGSRLRAVYAGRPDKVITVRGDGRAQYQEVIAAMDSARGAGVRVISLAPRRAPSPD